MGLKKQNPGCACCGATCVSCTGTVPEEMQVDISGLANDATCGASADCINFEGTYILPLTVAGAGGCTWTKTFTLSPTACGLSSITVSVFMPPAFFSNTIEVEFLVSVGRARFQKAQSMPFDCASPSGTSIAYLNETAGTVCNWSGATCLLTAL